MTYIEFFDRVSVENICACLSARPRKVIFLGKGEKELSRHIARYRRIFENHGLSIEIEYLNVDCDQMDAMVEALCAVVEREKNCAFDLTGGEETTMVAVGVVYERYRNNDRGIVLSLCRSNVKSFTPTAPSDAEGLPADGVALSVEENVMLYGGDVVYSDEHPDGTYRWDMNDRFCRDIERIWSICRKSVRSWNVQIDILGALEELCEADRGSKLRSEADFAALEHALWEEGKRYEYHAGVIDALCAEGYLTEFFCDNKTIRVGYRDEQIKRCLTRAGQALEMKIFLAMRRLTDKRGNPYFGDVANGVFIDWDGVVNSGNAAADPVNEIDIMAMRGLTPYFISCKNGRVTADELYKMQTVARRFGGTYARLALVVNSLKKDARSEAIRQRANEMNITLIENVHQMKSDADLARELQKIR